MATPIRLWFSCSSKNGSARRKYERITCKRKEKTQQNDDILREGFFTFCGQRWSWAYGVILVMNMVVLPLLVQLPHVHQTILHLLQTPDLLPSTPTANLNGWFTEHCIPLHTHTYTHTHNAYRDLVALNQQHASIFYIIFMHVYVCLCVCKTLRFALRLSEGICRVTLYSVCLSSSSEMKQASCTRRFALTICSLNRRRLLTSTTSLVD